MRMAYDGQGKKRDPISLKAEKDGSLTVREDLPPGLQAAQACHAVREFASIHPALDQEWFDRSKTLVLVGVPDEAAVHALTRAAARAGAPFAINLEPDLDDQATAVALTGKEAKRLVRELPLLLSVRLHHSLVSSSNFGASTSFGAAWIVGSGAAGTQPSRPMSGSSSESCCCMSARAAEPGLCVGLFFGRLDRLPRPTPSDRPVANGSAGLLAESAGLPIASGETAIVAAGLPPLPSA